MWASWRFQSRGQVLAGNERDVTAIVGLIFGGFGRSDHESIVA